MGFVSSLSLVNLSHEILMLLYTLNKSVDDFMLVNRFKNGWTNMIHGKLVLPEERWVESLRLFPGFVGIRFRLPFFR